MMPSTPSSAARAALLYITGGALLVIWSGVWYIYMLSNVPASNGPYYWCGGFVVTGLAFIFIGLGIGRIGREAKQADLPSETVVTTPVGVDGQHGVVTAPVATQPVVQTPAGNVQAVKPPATVIR